MIKKLKNLIKKSIKSKLKQINYFRKKQFIPDILEHINIESTSVCNLKCKFCAYDKRDLNEVPLQSMGIEFFKNITNQCLELGYRNFGLTPVTGDIFMDKNIADKLSYLETLDKLTGYYFYTNFIAITDSKIVKLFEYNKLTNLGLSIYGHDEESFIKFSKGTKNSYKVLLRNLNFFYNYIKEKKYNFKIELTQRTSKNFNLEESSSDLSIILKKLRAEKNVEYDISSSFTNWGGLVTEDHVSDLDINFQTELTKKTGSCSLIYSRLSIGADGVVNACACRDANFSLQIGDLKKDNLKKIISYKNDKYKNLINNQEKNNFSDVCSKCDFYRSIYEKSSPTWYLKEKETNVYSLAEVIQQLDKR